MAGQATGSGLADPLRVLWDGGMAAGVGDGPLLARFAAGTGDDDGAGIAFEALVERHGPMVFRVCLGLLGDRHAAEDAFQAVFLVLARRAASIGRPDRLAPWLHGVALRVAREARSRERRRRARDRAAAEDRAGPDAGSDWPGLPIARREAAEALHAAIDRLPAPQQAAVVLCDLEGLAVVEAASRLGCPPSTLGVRLMRARRTLRARLAGREPGLLAALPTPRADLIGATARLAGRIAPGPGAASALALGVLRSMKLARLKAAGAAFTLAAGLVAAGGWASTHRTAMAAPQVEPARPAAAQAPPQPARPPEDVPEFEVARPIAREVPEVRDFTGRTEASRSIQVHARVGGTIEKAEARVGAKVKAGSVLFEIDARSYQIQKEIADAQVDQARARLARAEADLRRVKAPEPNETIGRLIGREVVDRAVGEEAEARALLAVAVAGLKRANLDLEATRVLAPSDGEVGQRFAEVGARVKAGETWLATVVATDPIAVTIDIDQQTFLRLRRLILAGKLAAEIPVGIALDDEGVFSRQGKVELEGGQANPGPGSGTIRIHSKFPNADRALIPGLFARVRLEVGPARLALLVPRSALTYDTLDVYDEEARALLHVLGDRDVVEVRTIDLGPQHGAFREVRKGVKAGDRFIIARHGDVRPGTIVKLRESAPPGKP